MNLYKISQGVNLEYDTFDSAVVCQENEEAARRTHPSGKREGCWLPNGDWCEPEKVKVEYLGVAAPGTKPGVVVARNNSGRICD